MRHMGMGKQQRLQSGAAVVRSLAVMRIPPVARKGEESTGNLRGEASDRTVLPADLFYLTKSRNSISEPKQLGTETEWISRPQLGHHCVYGGKGYVGGWRDNSELPMC